MTRIRHGDSSSPVVPEKPGDGMEQGLAVSGHYVGAISVRGALVTK